VKVYPEPPLLTVSGTVVVRPSALSVSGSFVSVVKANVSTYSKPSNVGVRVTLRLELLVVVRTFPNPSGVTTVLLSSLSVLVVKNVGTSNGVAAEMMDPLRSRNPPGVKSLSDNPVGCSCVVFGNELLLAVGEFAFEEVLLPVFDPEPVVVPPPSALPVAPPGLFVPLPVLGGEVPPLVSGPLDGGEVGGEFEPPVPDPVEGPYGSGKFPELVPPVVEPVPPPLFEEVPPVPLVGSRGGAVRLIPLENTDRVPVVGLEVVIDMPPLRIEGRAAKIGDNSSIMESIEPVVSRFSDCSKRGLN
jgi:hypothetical protein